MIAYNREDRDGGGIALVFKENHKVKKKMEKKFKDMPICVVMDKLHLNILGLYHPPNSKVNKYSNGDFEEFLELMVVMILSYDKLITMGNLNLHLNNLDDCNTEFFIDTIKAQGLLQEVNFSNHNGGNIINAATHELQDKLKIVTCYQGPFPSDHCIVNCVVSHPRENMTTKIINYRKINDIYRSQLNIGIR